MFTADSNEVHLQVWLGKLEGNFLSRKLLVDGGEGVRLMLDVGLLGLVEVDLEQPCSVQTDPEHSLS